MEAAFEIRRPLRATAGGRGGAGRARPRAAGGVPRGARSDAATMSGWHVVRSFESDAPGAEFGASSTSFRAKRLDLGRHENKCGTAVFRDGTRE